MDAFQRQPAHRLYTVDYTLALDDLTYQGEKQTALVKTNFRTVAMTEIEKIAAGPPTVPAAWREKCHMYLDAANIVNNI